MKNTQGIKKKMRDPNREHMTNSEIWSAFTDNLKEWRHYLWGPEDKNSVGLKGSVRHVRRSIARWRRGNRQASRQAAYRRHQFPESENALAQFLLFIGASIPYKLDRMRDRLHFRRKKRLKRSGNITRALDEIKLHPVMFLSSALLIAAVCALLSVFTVGVSVIYDGYYLGTISGRSEAKAIVCEIEDVTCRTLQDSSYTIDRTLLQLKTDVVLRGKVETKEELAEELTDRLGMVEDAYVLYVNDEPVVATVYEGAMEELLEQLKIGYITPDTVDCYFDETVEIRHEYTDREYVKNLGYIAETLYETKEGEITYTVEKGDSYYAIADAYDISVDDLYRMNPGYDPKLLRVGDVLIISNAVPYLTMINVERQNYVQDVPYQVEYEDDDSMYQGEYKVIEKGIYGKADVTANVTYINGEERQREVVASAMLLRPSTERQKRGTKERPSWMPSGSFRWPCNGVITSRFGYRNTGIRGASTYHEGIDIGNSYGTPIYASDGGTVTYAGWKSGYGYMVIIDHMNGYETYYSHCSSLLTSVGSHVYKGEQIAKMGSTGISSGNHLDFRIRLNNTFVNPLNYL